MSENGVPLTVVLAMVPKLSRSSSAAPVLSVDDLLVRLRFERQILLPFSMPPDISSTTQHG